jgi:peroxiredoxin
MNVGNYVPQVMFRFREEIDICTVDKKSDEGWLDVWSHEIFSGRKVVVFGLPGAFTPTCSSQQVPGFEEAYDQMKSLGVDEVYCVSVNDPFVMKRWMEDQGAEKVKYIPDGNGTFTRRLGMLVDKSNLGFGMRSWRYAMVVENGEITYFNAEPGIVDNCPGDPYVNSTPAKVIDFLQAS